ncbi:MAG: phosphonopyruvate decarboxylase [Quinella sp. 1Q5]|nr:phosphonopyruvate decarboxylase [Quinella sp. 1Q5]
MKVEDFVQILGTDFYTGVPDSLLKPLCSYLMQTYGTDPVHNLIAANEGNCVALAAGYHLATSKVAAVYLQNSGEGNIINPVASLLSEKVYGIPMIFIIGFRGEPGIHDEPQHVFQGEITLKLLEVMNIDYFILDRETTESELQDTMITFRKSLAEGKQVAFVVRKDALSYNGKFSYANGDEMKREYIIRRIVEVSGDDIIVCTTGKASRELFEIREMRGESHDRDFLTVGSMGHSSSIALGIALQRLDKRVWCIDGDGAALMHMGAMAVIGGTARGNLVHVVINNKAHDSVGGMPTVAGKIDFSKIAVACGYTFVAKVNDDVSLGDILNDVRTRKERCFVEIESTIGARATLGRPTVSPQKNKQALMKFIAQ